MKQPWLTALACLTTIAFGTACVPGAGGAGGGGGASAACAGDMGTTAAAARIEGFLSATSAFNQASYELERDMIGACKRMGRALGMSDAELQGDGTQGMRSVCRAVNARYQSEMQAIRSANVQVNITAQPPQCQVSVDAYARCAAECDVTVDPGTVELECHGGEIRGECSAQCTGSCAVSVSGSCSGRCEGACNGTCSATNADGSCAGQCSGQCQGQCVVQGQASCQGECRGGCSVEFTRPYCTTEVRAPHVEAECQADCQARVEAQASCQPGQLAMTTSGSMTDPAYQARVARVREATQDGLASIVTLRVRAQRLARSGADVARRAPGAASGAVALGAHAASCAAAAASATAQAMASVQVSVEVSVEVSASASASASGG